MANDKREAAWQKEYAGFDDYRHAWNSGYDAGHAAATAEGIPQAAGWVAIETVDDLPKEDGGYLATFPGDGEYVVGELFLRTDNHQRNWEAGGDGWPDDFKPIAWQPLPAPYQRQSREGE